MHHPPCPNCAARAGSFGNPFANESVHYAGDAPSYTHWPDEKSNQELISSNKLVQALGSVSNPFIYAKPQQGPPPQMRGPVRHDDQDGWYQPTYPCTGPKPIGSGERSLCDPHTGKWYVPATQQAGSWGGSLINLAPCGIDRMNPPPVGSHGKPQCDRFTGRYSYDSVDGYPGVYDGNSMAAFSSYRRGRDGIKKLRGGLEGNRLHYDLPSVALDRAYDGAPGVGVPFQNQETGRLHPALTDMGGNRARGHYQKNSQIRTNLRQIARPDPLGLARRGGYMMTARTSLPKYRMGAPFTPYDYRQAASIYQRPHLITEADMARQHQRSSKTSRGKHN